MDEKNETDSLVAEIKDKMRFSQLAFAGAILVIGLASAAEANSPVFNAIRLGAFLIWTFVIVWEHNEIGKTLQRYENRTKSHVRSKVAPKDSIRLPWEKE